MISFKLAAIVFSFCAQSFATAYVRLGKGRELPRNASLVSARSTLAGHSGEWLFLFRVFGRLPGTEAMKSSEAGVRKASREETAGGVCAGGGVSLWGFDARLRAALWISDEDAGRICGAMVILVGLSVVGRVLSW